MLAMVLNRYGLNLAYTGGSVSADEFCYACIILALVEQDVSMPCNGGDQLQLGSSQLIKSWARWPSVNRFFDVGPAPSSGSFEVVSPNTLVIDLYFLNRLLLQPNKLSLESASRFFNTAEVATLLKSLTLGTRRTAQHFINSLAVGLDCGLEWITGVSRVIHRSSGGKILSTR
jgi:hypothetical protein